ncbi:hypothetical protein GCM10009821_10250 [Aeromicrobium halocynthiae]|uniref:MFS transporter n=1 Tax=Aeromicrobium halocynthiae TaxID=560557 RepID=A0ABN2VUX7_9ACTN
MLRWHLTSGAARWVRGGVVAALTVGLGTGAHVAAGGHAPPVTLLALVTIVLTGLAVAVAGRRFDASGLLGLFLLAQTGIHLTAMAAAPHGSMTDPAMIATHVLAAAALVLVVLHGERALLASLDHLLPRIRADRTSAPRPRATVVACSPRPLVGSAAPADLLGRAPPVPS